MEKQFSRMEKQFSRLEADVNRKTCARGKRRLRRCQAALAARNRMAKVDGLQRLLAPQGPGGASRPRGEVQLGEGIPGKADSALTSLAASCDRILKKLVKKHVSQTPSKEEARKCGKMWKKSRHCTHNGAANGRPCSSGVYKYDARWFAIRMDKMVKGYRDTINLARPIANAFFHVVSKISKCCARKYQCEEQKEWKKCECETKKNWMWKNCKKNKEFPLCKCQEWNMCMRGHVHADLGVHGLHHCRDGVHGIT